MTGAEWHDDMPDDMSDSLRNAEAALERMIAAIDDGRYRFEAIHVRADLAYLRAEIRRAKRQYHRVSDRVSDHDPTT